MSEPKYRDWILETIDSLRSRKARPDLERICRMVRRRYGSDPDRTRLELEKLIQEQTVLKVSYKGSISYRNAAKVHRKSRKKPEATAERSRHADGDRTHSPTHAAEGTDCPAGSTEGTRCRDLQPGTPAVPSPKDGAPVVPASGNGCLGCGAAVCKSQPRCAASKASAPKERRAAQTGGTGASAGREKCTGTGNGNERDAPGKNRASRGLEGGLSGQEGSNDKERRTCTSSHLLRRKKQVSLKPKLRVARKAGGRGAPEPGSPDLGDRLVAYVRTLAEKNRGATAARGHPPLGLKEILGFLSTQERLSQEKLTRSKVKVVLEREVARGRLRRTRFGNITLPMRGVGVARPSARLLKSALQDRHTAKKVVKEVEPMEVNNGEPEEEKEEEVQKGGNGGSLSLAKMDTEASLGQSLQPPEPFHSHAATPTPGPSLEVDTPDVPTVPAERSLLLSSSPSPNCTSSKKEGDNLEMSPNHGCPEEGMCTDLRADIAGGLEGGQSPQPVCPPAPDTEDGAEQRVLTPEPPASDPQGMVVPDGENLSPSPSAQSCSGCKVETGVASCLLTPTASPQEAGAIEEQGMNGAVLVKTEKTSQNLVEWTVADVASYFIAAGFPEQAAAFRTQEIDGKSLLLMQRNDVLTGLSIRLGPALKIYERHIKVLQRTHFQDDSALC